MALARKINLTFYLTTFKLQHRKAATAKEWFFFMAQVLLKSILLFTNKQECKFLLKTNSRGEMRDGSI